MNTSCIEVQPCGLCTVCLHSVEIAHSGALSGGELQDISPACLTFFATLPPLSFDVDDTYLIQGCGTKLYEHPVCKDQHS